MPTKRIEHIDLPYAGRRHSPDHSRLSALYSRGGEVLADIALRKGENAARMYGQLAGLFTNYQETGRQKKATELATSIRAAERAQDRNERDLERLAAEAVRKQERDDRQRAEDRGAARFMVSDAAPGPVDNALADFARRFPETAARFSGRSTLPATVTPGAFGEVGPGGEPFSVLEPNADQEARSRAELAASTEREAAAARATTDDTRMAAQAAEAKRHNIAIENKPTGERATAYEWVTLPNGDVRQVPKGTAPEGSKPYSAAAAGGLASVQVQVRNRRAAAALNSIEKLKSLAPKRTPGPMGIAEGAVDVAAGYAGYSTKTRQYQALIQPTAMQMAVSIQGAANLSDTERETMAKMLGSIATMDYESQIALLDNASELIRNGADVQQIDVKDPKTGILKKTWKEAPRSMAPGPGAVAPSDPLGLGLPPKP